MMEFLTKYIPSLTVLHAIVAEMERTKWRQFRSYLDKKDVKVFDKMYDYFKLHNAACSNACRPEVIHAVLMSSYSNTTGN